MTSVHSIDTIKELERFFTIMYGEQTGYVYSPTKNLETEEWTQHFFEWPTGRMALIQHIVAKSQTLDVYYSPALFTEPKSQKSAFKGSNYVWVDFDGNAPPNANNLPEPCIKIQSSIPGREHWYWKLEGFITEIKVIENITQRLAYHLNADKGGWDANQVLRPPYTRHQGTGNTVTALKLTTVPTSIGSFIDVPDLPVTLLHEDDIKYVPQPLKVIFKYKWETEHYEFFLSKIEYPHRSGALTRLCFVCIEMGMDDGECLSILKQADDRWGKYAKRQNQRHWLVKIINRCRVKKALQKLEEKPEEPKVEEDEEESPYKVYNFIDFLQSERKLEWAIPNLVHKKGIAFLSGPQGIGKSQISLRLCEKLARGEKFLVWEPEQPMRTLYLSMEMAYEEVKHFGEAMQITEDDAIRNNMFIAPVGFSEKLNNPIVQNEINGMMEEHKPEGVIIDSFGVAIGDDLTGEKIIFDAFRYVRRVLNGHYGAFVWFIHHPRKAQVGNKKPNTLDDMFGSGYIGNQARTVIGVWETADKTEIEVECLKLSLTEKFKPFNIKRTPNLDFKIVEDIKAKSVFGSSYKGKSNIDPTELGKLI